MIINDMVLGNLVWAELPPRLDTKYNQLDNSSAINPTDTHEKEWEDVSTDIDKKDDDTDLVDQ